MRGSRFFIPFLLVVLGLILAPPLFGEGDARLEAPHLIDLKTLPDESALFTLYLPLEVWRDRLLPFAGEDGSAGSIRRAAKPYLDPRAEMFLSPEILNKTSEFALSIWPDIEVGGDSRPVWMMGFTLDSPEAAARARGLLQEELAPSSGRPLERSFGDVDVFTIDTPAKDLHFASPGKTLLVSSNLIVLQSFLAAQSHDPLPLPPVSGSTNLTWKTRPPDPAKRAPLPLLNSFLWNVGVREVECEFTPMDPGYRLRMVFEGDLQVEPPVGMIEYDFDLVDQVPANADFVLMGGRLPLEEIYFSPELPSLPAISTDDSGQGFAFGVSIPDGTATVGVSSEIAGAYRRNPEPIPSDLLPADILPATNESQVSENQVARFGDLELAIVEGKDSVAFRNTARLSPPKNVERRLRSVLENRRSRVQPSLIALISPHLLVRPIDLEWERIRSEDPGSPFIGFWPLIRPLFEPIDLAVFSTSPDSIEIEMNSRSLISPLSLIAEFANLLTILDEGDLSLLNQWFGELGPLSDRRRNETGSTR